ncbi:MAG: MBL fold metallo-hydrolase, partial [Lachnospiraceae bacterium]|nr:MBL fold metallo-hydrolase [Lachnospiraceae bacterium]
TEGDLTKTLVFSGDIGNTNQPIIQDPTYLDRADYVVMESTYGNRRHEPHTDYAHELAPVLQRTFDRGGNVVIPSFAVGRTQEMLYFIRQIKQAGMVKGHDGFEVYVDSPLAVEATSVFMERMYSDFDEEARELLDQGINPISFDGLRVSVSSDESKAINEDPKPKVIISASGMCDAGRIKHHLKHNLWRKECTILFVGYQSEGTLGRKLADGEKKVKVFSEDIEVNAEVLELPGISGHADSEGLMRWIASIQNPSKVFITHGEDTVCEIFAARVKEELGYDTYAPYSGTIFNLASGELEYEAPARPIVTETTETLAVEKKAVSATVTSQLTGMLRTDSRPGKAASGVYSSLVKAVERLIELVNRYQGAKEGDIKKFARALEKLCDKWEEDRS